MIEQSSVSIAISVVALILSLFTLWFANFRRGRLLLSQPTIFFFGHDQSDSGWDHKSSALPKIMFRAALFSTAKRGILIEAMFIKIQNREGAHDFSFWGYDDGKGMVRGSGLFIFDNGHIANHHFNPPGNKSEFKYCIGEYEIEVYACLYGKDKPILLGRYEFDVKSDELAFELNPEKGGLLWDWLPHNQSYLPVSRRPKKEAP